MITKTPLPDGKRVRVTFELPSSIWAERISLVGDFNDWDSTRHDMQQSGEDGNWRVSLELPRGSEFQFRYLVNGSEWHNDWQADGYVRNQYGTDNSVLLT